MTLLTIAVTTCRRPALLLDCLGSVCEQIIDETEVLVIDNDPAKSAEPTTSGFSDPRVRYVHEPRVGVAHARNRAVKESSGRYVAFIDDDEVAQPGWVLSMLRQIELGSEASFGRVVPHYLGSPEAGLESVLAQLYSRDLAHDADADVSAEWAWLGTGNSLFEKDKCLGGASPFAEHLNATGGEDTWLIRGLVRQGIRMTWNPSAVVLEQVTSDRLTLEDVRRRKFRLGQTRSSMVFGSGGARGYLAVAAWMSIGLAQYVIHSALSFVQHRSSNHRWKSHSARASGGRGKLVWWRLRQSLEYERTYRPDAPTRGQSQSKEGNSG